MWPAMPGPGASCSGYKFWPKARIYTHYDAPGPGIEGHIEKKSSHRDPSTGLSKTEPGANGIAIHRIVPNFVVQAGDPRGDSEGGPGYSVRDELNQLPYLRGVVGMALDWADTGGSQFFITLSPQPHLDARHTAFGRVVTGMDVVDRLEPWDVIQRVRIWDGEGDAGSAEK